MLFRLKRNTEKWIARWDCQPEHQYTKQELLNMFSLPQSFDDSTLIAYSNCVQTFILTETTATATATVFETFHNHFDQHQHPHQYPIILKAHARFLQAEYMRKKDAATISNQSCIGQHVQYYQEASELGHGPATVALFRIFLLQSIHFHSNVQTIYRMCAKYIEHAANQGYMPCIRMLQDYCTSDCFYSIRFDLYYNFLLSMCEKAAKLDNPEAISYCIQLHESILEDYSPSPAIHSFLFLLSFSQFKQSSHLPLYFKTLFSVASEQQTKLVWNAFLSFFFKLTNKQQQLHIFQQLNDYYHDHTNNLYQTYMDQLTSYGYQPSGFLAQHVQQSFKQCIYN